VICEREANNQSWIRSILRPVGSYIEIGAIAGIMWARTLVNINVTSVTIANTQ